MLAIYRYTASVRLKANYISQRIYREKVNRLIRETNTQESLLKRDGIITTICHRRKLPRTKLIFVERVCSCDAKYYSLSCTSI